MLLQKCASQRVKRASCMHGGHTNFQTTSISYIPIGGACKPAYPSEDRWLTSECYTPDKNCCYHKQQVSRWYVTHYIKESSWGPPKLHNDGLCLPGKTQPYNVVDLSQFRSHQGYYTSLSRSAMAARTLILSSFHPSKIPGGGIWSTASRILGARAIG